MTKEEKLKILDELLNTTQGLRIFQVQLAGTISNIAESFVLSNWIRLTDYIEKADENWARFNELHEKLYKEIEK